jgi:Cof subfamily protein (haloacid dehalogenase superfamily)
MDLIFFDLDGTLLNKSSELTTFTQETLNLLNQNNIAYTVATGRTMISAQRVIGHHPFELPHIYSNGVAIWDPRDNGLTLENLLSHNEVEIIIDTAFRNGLAPFVNTVSSNSANHDHIIFHGETHHQIERDLINNYFSKTDVMLLPLVSLPSDYQGTNVSMIGSTKAVKNVYEHLQQFDTLVAYSGPATEGDQYSWIDVHHRLANKGSAVENLKYQLGASNVICFGDSDNDLSMFALADECYAPQNATEEIKGAANDVIGHHHNDGVAQFLRDRFNL